MRALLKIRFKDSGIAEAVHGALRPDDSNPPKDFTIDSVAEGVELTYLVRSGRRPSEGLLTMLSVLDEISRLSELIEKVIDDICARRPS